MKINKIILLPLLLWMVSCNEEVPPIETENEVAAPLVSSITYVDAQTNETRTTNYFYDNGLLTRVNFGNGTHTIYKYENDQLIARADFIDGEAEKGVTYVYGDGVVSTIHQANNMQFSQVATEFEYVMGDSEAMVVNVYELRNGSRQLQHYSVCRLENGNVVEETRFYANGDLASWGSLATFNTVLDPMSQLKGHPPINSLHMATSTSYYENGQLWSDHILTNYEVNEHNYPDSYELVSICNGDTLRSTVTYEYQ